MALVGYSVMVSVPVLSTAWVGLLGFSEEQVGRVAGADLGGLSIGAIMASLLVARVNRQVLVLAGLILSIVANALCIGLVEYEQVLWLRLAAGFGSGIFTAVAVVSLGGTTKPVRAFNMLLFAFAFSTALELHTLPRLTMSVKLIRPAQPHTPGVLTRPGSMVFNRSTRAVMPPTLCRDMNVSRTSAAIITRACTKLV